MRIFLDSSVIIAALHSKTGASSQILALSQEEILEVFISNQVEEEVMDVLERKYAYLKPIFRSLLKTSKLKQVKTSDKAMPKGASAWIKDPKDIKILIGAKAARAHYLITLDLRDFIKDKTVAEKTGLAILTPGEFLNELHTRIF
ncbi:MAG: putative toxin-antitoxin system toxin component, PIN family [Candidatus Gracilibacteria bacterium]